MSTPPHDLASMVIGFIKRGETMQAAVDRILAEHESAARKPNRHQVELSHIEYSRPIFARQKAVYTPPVFQTLNR
jgi:hypothetical protein